MIATTRERCEAIAGAHAVGRRRMERFRKWARSQDFCREGLRCLALARTPEGALLSASVTKMSDDANHLIEAPAMVGAALGLWQANRWFYDVAFSNTDEARELDRARTVIASPVWTAMFGRPA